MNNNRLIVTIIILVLALGGIGWFLNAKGMLPGGASNSTGSTANAKPSDWQAVFLSNGQVYFGKLESDNGQFLTLSNIYYLQVNQTGQTTANASPDPSQQQVSLVKLGNELHGPVDKMRLNRDHVIFIEQMKSDSKVVDAIQRYIKEGPAPIQQQPAQTEPATTPSPKK